MFNNVIAPFFIGAEPGLKKIRKKENLHNGKKDEELDQDDDPELPADGHIPEAVVVKPEDPKKNIAGHCSKNIKEHEKLVPIV